jgi:hypothetical protein
MQTDSVLFGNTILDAEILHMLRDGPIEGSKKGSRHYPDEEEEEANGSTAITNIDRRPSVNGAINHARPRPVRIPRVVSQSYPTFKGKQECALRIGIHEIFDQEISKSTGISHVEITSNGLTIFRHSQSKLSQQELIDLQKATHFDKKELQQWYKGMRSLNLNYTM